MRAARTDANHAEIVQAFRQCGARVLSLAKVGNGCPDLLVYVGCVLRLVEVKRPKAKGARAGTLTPDQERFHAEWPVITVRTLADVETIVRLMQSVELIRRR